MPSPRSRRLRMLLIALLLLGAGFWLAGSALWQLGKTALFVHESVVVTGTVVDVRQKPFETWSETLGKGNWSWPGDVSYQPIVRFTLPGGIDAVHRDLAADNVDYRTGQGISIICPPGQPGKALINRGKFLWGPSSLRLGIGSLLALLGYALTKRLKGHRGAATAAQPARQEKPTPAKAARKRSSNAAPRAPRRKKKAEDSPAEGASAPQKPRRSRKKKAEGQLELGL